MLFSYRKGLKPVKSIMQVDNMDNDLRNNLWNALTIYYWNDVKDDFIENYKDINYLVENIYIFY